MRQVWIDTDMGFDDIVAIAMVAIRPDVIAGVSLVAGNAPLDRVTRNARDAAGFFGWTISDPSGPRPAAGRRADDRRLCAGRQAAFPAPAAASPKRTPPCPPNRRFRPWRAILKAAAATSWRWGR
jgi:purine nucleosidase